jgi:hypothetical protein
VSALREQRSNRLNILLDDEHAAKLDSLAGRLPGLLRAVESLLANPDAANVTSRPRTHQVGPL